MQRSVQQLSTRLAILLAALAVVAAACAGVAAGNRISAEGADTDAPPVPKSNAPAVEVTHDSDAVAASPSPDYSTVVTASTGQAHGDISSTDESASFDSSSAGDEPLGTDGTTTWSLLPPKYPTPTSPPPTTTTSSPPPTTTTTSVPPGGRWMPAPGTTWQWQLTGSIDTSVDAQMYNVDLFDVPTSVVDELRAAGRAVVCYMSAGSWEDWRPDADDFPSQVLGNSNGWPGEKWLDIRRIDLLGPIMEARMDLCAAKGFDAVEVDNIDGYTNNTGFPLSGSDQIAYNRFLAQAAHARGLSIALKNDLEQVEQLVGDFDFAINEQCAQYDECERLTPFIAAGKAVFHVEYELSRGQFCDDTTALGFSSMRKRYDLDAWRRYCD